MRTFHPVRRSEKRPEAGARGRRFGQSGDLEPSGSGMALPATGHSLEKILGAFGSGGTPRVSPKLEVSRPGDPMEEEADRIAERVMEAQAPPPSPNATGIQGTARSTQQVSRSTGRGIIQRTCDGCTPGAPCPECEENETMMRKSDQLTEASSSISDPVHTVRELGTGLPIDSATREFMESRLGHDFSQVRLHTDAKAARSAKAFNALGYTVGRDIVLGAGQYPSGTSRATKVLAHELVHVIQQGNAGEGRISGSIPSTRDPGTSGLVARESGPPFGVVTVLSRSPGEGRLMRKDDQPQGSTPTRIEGSTGSISWIDPGAPAGQGKLAVPDPTPPENITEGFITGSSGFRFSNYLHGFVETSDNSHVANNGFLADSDIHTSPSFAGLSSYTYPRKQSSTPVADGGVEGVEFEQTVGARTVSPAKIAAGVGTGVGILGGIWAGVKIGGITGGIFGEGIGAIPGAIIGGIIGGVAGFFAGSTAGNVIFNFPPIWTRLKLRLLADGRKTCNQVEHSIFPSSTYYCNLGAFDHYSALAPEQAKWGDAGWGGGNPWGAEKPIATP